MLGFIELILLALIILIFVDPKDIPIFCFRLGKFFKSANDILSDLKAFYNQLCEVGKNYEKKEKMKNEK